MTSAVVLAVAVPILGDGERGEKRQPTAAVCVCVCVCLSGHLDQLPHVSWDALPGHVCNAGEHTSARLVLLRAECAMRLEATGNDFGSHDLSQEGKSATGEFRSVKSSLKGWKVPHGNFGLGEAKFKPFWRNAFHSFTFCRFQQALAEQRAEHEAM